MEDDDTVLIAAATVVLSCCALLLRKSKKKRRRRRWWMVSLHRSRERYNGSNMLSDLRQEPSGKFENFCRMSAIDFEYLLNLIGPTISKKDTHFRKAIPAQERLAVTLRFLASGDTFTSLSYLFKMSAQTISCVVLEVCTALNDALKDEIQLPKTNEEWKKVADRFKELWNFPHCMGALDGKHVILQASFNSESEFFNYKKSFSIVLMALVDADYCFTFVDVGTQGRLNDSGIFRSTTLYQKLQKGELNTPPEEPLPGRTHPVPYVFIGDDAFPMSPNLLKPFPGHHDKGGLERVFNYRLSRARRIVENAFGILASVFRMLRSPMLLQPHKAATVTLTCTLLHNFLRKSNTSRNLYSPGGTLDTEKEGQLIPGLWRQDNTPSSLTSLHKKPRKPSEEAKEIRREFAEYFMTNGSIPWQEQYC